MTVKVIGIDVQVVRRTTCPDCASILEFTNLDVQSGQYSCMGDIDTWYWITCPTCSKRVEVGRKE